MEKKKKEEEKNIFVPINKEDIKVTWDDVKGLKEAKKALMQAVVLPQARPEFFTGPRKAMKGILLYGPPGTGKTFIAKAIAAKSVSAFLSISSADILSKWVGEGAKNVKRLFDAARENSPCTIFIDEIDSMCKKRGEKTSESLGQIKTEFLAQMDGIGSDKDRVFVLGATNLPWALDDALLRRFQKRIYIPLPDDKARAGIISSNLGERDALPQEYLKKVVKKTEGYNGSDLKNLVSEAAMQPVEEVQEATEFKKVKQGWWQVAQRGDKVDYTVEFEKIPKNIKIELRKVVYDDFTETLENFRPSVNQDAQKQFIDWTEKYGQKGTGSHNHKECAEDLKRSTVQHNIQARKFGGNQIQKVEVEELDEITEVTPEQIELKKLKRDFQMMEKIIADQKMKIENMSR